jgi:hypothetical protein
VVTILHTSDGKNSLDILGLRVGVATINGLVGESDLEVVVARKHQSMSIAALETRVCTWTHSPASSSSTVLPMVSLLFAFFSPLSIQCFFG